MLFYNEKIFKRCFNWRGKYWYKNIKEIPLYFRLMHHLIKYGYDEYATWETFDWFINIMKDILTYYRKHHHGYPVPSFDDDYSIEEFVKHNHKVQKETYEKFEIKHNLFGASGLEPAKSVHEKMSHYFINTLYKNNTVSLTGVRPKSL